MLKTLEKTHLKLWPGLDALQIRELAECRWISSRDNLILAGKHGTGKSHAATVNSSPPHQDFGSILDEATV